MKEHEEENSLHVVVWMGIAWMGQVHEEFQSLVSLIQTEVVWWWELLQADKRADSQTVEAVITAVLSTSVGGCVSTGAVGVVIKALESAELG